MAPSTSERYAPPAQHLVALAICIAASLLLLWPLLTGRILLGGARSDMFIAGYSFRLFGAEWFKNTGSIPQWNPYLFGGLPYIGAMHGDIFYPSAWLRWVMPVDLAITWAMALHFVLAGWWTYRFTHALGLSWGAAVIAGVSYELTGIVASQMSPGHDGKLFVSALTPLAFWTLLAAIRWQRAWAYGAFAVVVALTVLGHYHMSYFLLIALGLWAVFLAFWDAERPTKINPWQTLGFAMLAVFVGVGITAIQVLPFLSYIPYSPRAAGGPDTGWAFATSYAFPPSEIVTLALPEFNGFLNTYWGTNGGKLHTEYVGFLPLALAVLGLGDRSRRNLAIAFAIGALVFLFFSFGGHTPFYRPFFELLPGLKKIRAMGMVFYLVGFALSVLAAIGADRVLSRRVSLRSTLTVISGFALFALLGVVGGLQSVAQSLALPERVDIVNANASEIRLASVRLLVFVALGGAFLWGAVKGRMTVRLAITGLTVLLATDLWSVDRRFFQFSPRAKILFAIDPVTAYLQKMASPYRAIDLGQSYGHSILMAYRIPVAMGYHGFELRNYDELGGAGSGWTNLLSPTLLDLLAIRFAILPEEQPIPGFHKVVGPTPTPFATTAVLYESDSPPPYARVIVTAAKVPEAEVVGLVTNPRFPARAAIVLPDTSTAVTAPIKQPLPLSRMVATVRDWAPGSMTVGLTGEDSTAGHLLISENWYPDWQATVDGKPATVRRADHSLLSVDLPRGAREVRLSFNSPAYARGKIVSLFALLVATGMIFVPIVRERRGK